MIKRVTEKISNDVDFKELISGASISFFLKVSAAILSLLFNLLITKHFTKSEVGSYFFVLTIVTILSSLSRMGIDLSSFILIARKKSKKEPIEKLIIESLLIVFISSVGWTFLVYFTSFFVSFQNDDTINNLLFIMGLSVIPLSLVFTWSEMLRGEKKMFSSQITISSFFLAPILYLIFFNDRSLEGLGKSYLIGLVLICCFVTISHLKNFKPLNLNTFNLRHSELFEINRPIFVISLSNILMMWAGSFILGMVSNTDEVANFNITLRIAFLLNFILIGINSILTAQISHLYSKQDFNRMQVLINKAIRLGSIVGLPLFLVMLFFPTFLLGFFGEDYESNSILLIILSVSQFFSLAAGPVGNILTVTDNQKIIRNIMLGTTLFYLLTLPLFSYILGALGAGIVYSIVIILQNILASYFVKKKLNIETSINRFIS